VVRGTVRPTGALAGIGALGAATGTLTGCGGVMTGAGAVLTFPVAFSTSSAVIRPWGPLPTRVFRSTFNSLASFLALGEATKRPLSLTAATGIETGGGAISGVSTGLLGATAAVFP